MKISEMLRFRIAVALSLCSTISSSSCCAADMVASWKQVHNELSPVGDVWVPPFNYFWTNSATMRRLVEDRNTNALLELAGQPDKTNTRLSAYFALRTFERHSALNVGLEIALSTSVITNPFVIHVLEALAQDLPKADFSPALTRAFSTSPINSSNARMLILTLPEEVLRNWFEDTKRPPSFFTYEALVLNRLYIESRRRSEAPTQRMKSALEQCVLVPGIPRVIFVTVAEEKHPLFKQALRFCLEDEGLTGDTLVSLVEVFASFIDGNIDVTSLDASKERRQSITDMLAKAKRIEFPRK